MSRRPYLFIYSRRLSLVIDVMPLPVVWFHRFLAALCSACRKRFAPTMSRGFSTGTFCAARKLIPT
jgi:hypothetical protein